MESADGDVDNNQPELYFENSDADSDCSSTDGNSEDETNDRAVDTTVLAKEAEQCNSKEGYLYKQGGVNRDQGWKKRYMKFDGKTLRYSKTKNSQASLRIIPVSNMMNVRPLGPGEGRRASTSSLFSSARAHQFELECLNRIYQFGTDDLDNAQRWQMFLMASILDSKKYGSKIKDGGEMCNPDVSGSIRFDKKRKKFFVVIKGDILRYYYNEQDYKIDSPIHELSMKLCNIKYDGHTKLQLSSPPNQHFGLNFDSADETTQWEMGITDAIEESLGDDEALNNVREHMPNRACADCQSPRAKFASINFGIVLCAKCAGIHRGFGATVSKVRSLRMDAIFKNNANVLQLFKDIGNANANAFWYKAPPTEYTVGKNMAVADRKIHLTRKYLKRAFADLRKDPKDQLNELFLASVRVNDIQNAMMCLYSGAEISHTSDEGKTAVEIAESLGHIVLKEFLLQNKEIELPALFTTHNGQVQMHCATKKTAIYYEGYLEKTGPNMKGFRKRWFVLHYGELSYYQERGKTSPKGKIRIMDDIVSVSASPSTERNHCFEISCKANKRVYRFAAPDIDARTAWMSALFKVICPTEILNEQLEECNTLAIAGNFYVKFEQGTWTRSWVTVRGNRLDIWSMTNMSHCLTVIIARGTKLFKYNNGRWSKLLDSSEDFKHLEGNQCVEIVHSTRLTKFQGILLQDTEKLYAFVDRYMASLEKRQ